MSIADVILTHAETVLLPLVPDAEIRGDELVGRNPQRTEDSSPGSFSINLATGVWADFATDNTKGGDVFSFIAHCRNTSKQAARKWAKQQVEGKDAAPAREAEQETGCILPVPLDAAPRPGNPDRVNGWSAEWEYTDAEGNLLCLVRRYPKGKGKECRTWTYRDNGQWALKRPPKPWPLYNLEGFLDDTLPVYITEGEKCADAVDSLLDGIGTTILGGCKAVKDADLTPLHGRHVVIVPDADEPGRRYAQKLVTRLQGKVESLRVVDVWALGWEDGKDIADIDSLPDNWDDCIRDDVSVVTGTRDASTVTGGKKSQEKKPVVYKILEEMPGTIARPLCLIDGIAYAATWIPFEKQIHQKFDKDGEVVESYDPPITQNVYELVVINSLGEVFSKVQMAGMQSLGSLDMEIKLDSHVKPSHRLQGAGLKRFMRGERPDPVAVFNAITDCVNHFVDFNLSFGTQQDMCDLVSCYIMTTWLREAFTVLGYLMSTGETGSGKTELLTVVSTLSHLGELVTIASSFATLRDSAHYGGSLCFDDAEKILDPKDKSFDPDKSSLLLAGNRKGVTIPHKEQIDNKWVTVHMDIFCSRAFSAIELPHQTLLNRTIVIPLVSSGDENKTKRDSNDPENWPKDFNLQHTLDDLWILSTCYLADLPSYNKKIARKTSLHGRALQPWRAILATALWLDDKGHSGLFDRMTKLSQSYQAERSQLELVSEDRAVLQVLLDYLYEKDPAGNPVVFATSELGMRIQEYAVENGLVEAKDGVEAQFISNKKLGNKLRGFRLKKPTARKSSAREWETTFTQIRGQASSHGITVTSCEGVSVQTSQESQTSQTSQAGEINDVSDANDISDVSGETPEANVTPTEDHENAEKACSPSGQDDGTEDNRQLLPGENVGNGRVGSNGQEEGPVSAVEVRAADPGHGGLGHSPEDMPAVPEGGVYIAHPVTGQSVPVHYITSLVEALAKLEVMSIGLPLGADLETRPQAGHEGVRKAALTPNTGQARLLQVSDGESILVIDLDQVDIKGLEKPLTRSPLVFHNSDFDTSFLLASGLDVDARCTQLETIALTAKNKPSLAWSCEQFLGYEVNKAQQVSNWSGELSAEQIHYAALDALLVYVLHQKLQEKLVGKKITGYQLVQDCIRPIAHARHHGVLLDVDRHQALVERWTAERDEAKERFLDIADGVDPESPKQLAEWLSGNLESEDLKDWPKTGKGQLSTDAESLKQFAHVSLVRPLLDYRHAGHRVKTWGITYQRHLCSDGRIRPGFQLLGARTGRMSSQRPNVQNLPRDPEFRACFMAPDGYQLVAADYSQIELRIPGILSGDNVIVDSYKAGVDLHRKIVHIFTGKPMNEITGDERKLGKAINFGLLYAGGAKTLQSYAKGNYGLDISLEQAEKYKRQFDQTYKKLRFWQLERYKQHREQGAFMTAGGRLVSFHDKANCYTDSRNYPIQGAAADLQMLAIARVHNHLVGKDVHLVNFVHDELVLEVAEDRVEDVVSRLILTMTDAFMGVFKRFPAARSVVHGLVEVGHGKNYADTKGAQA